jgi:N-acetyl sugar amidotransferase
MTSPGLDVGVDRTYRICTRCVMDTSDPDITFDAEGHCNHCSRALAVKDRAWITGVAGERALDAKIREIKARGGEHEGILGLSGGLDSSYLAYALARRGLKPLVVHVDAGWNSDVAVGNIRSLVMALDLELVTHVIPWNEMRDLQTAYLASGMANQDSPQDHAFFAALYQYAVKNGIRHVLSGSNFATESILPWAWGYTPMDGRLIKAVHERFGRVPLREFPLLTSRKHYVYHLGIKRMQVVAPLDWLPYSKDHARDVLRGELGWRDYGGKHEESRWTKFFQGYYLPTYFGYDKRRAHQASLIVSGQTTRDDAMSLLEQPSYDAAEVAIESDYIARKLGLSPDEFRALLESPKHRFDDYPNDAAFVRMVQNPRVTRTLKRLLRVA